MSPLVHCKILHLRDGYISCNDCTGKMNYVSRALWGWGKNVVEDSKFIIMFAEPVRFVIKQGLWNICHAISSSLYVESCQRRCLFQLQSESRCPNKFHCYFQATWCQSVHPAYRWTLVTVQCHLLVLEIWDNIINTNHVISSTAHSKSGLVT